MALSREFLYELHNNVSGEIRTDAASRILYSTDASMYRIEPLGVVLPRTREELQAAVELAARYKIPVLPRGAGTSLAGQAVGEALILDCSRWLDSIIEVNVEEHFAIVEPGVILSDLNRAASKHGMMFGPDPASADRATMGGVIANNATGAHSIVYGISADHLLEADVILSDGSTTKFNTSTVGSRDSNTRLKKIVLAVQEIREKYGDAIQQNYPKTWRNAAGYRLNYLLPWSHSAPAGWEGVYPPVTKLNFAPLLAGSEGTLAVIQRMKVNLVPKPKKTVLVVLSYASVAEACDDVPRLLTHSPSAIELIPQTILRAARSSAGYAREVSWIHGDPAALLAVEFSGGLDMAAMVEWTKSVSSPAAYSTTDEKIIIAESEEEQARIWNVRKVGLGLLDSKFSSERPIAFIEDCAIPVERLGEFVREVERVMSTHGVEGGMYAHASAGCLHIRPVLDLKTSRGVASLRAISEAVLELTLQLGGAMSSEHGDGLARSEHLTRMYGAEVIQAMQLLKDAADPDRILNPGKIINAEKMDVNLRYGVEYQTRPWKPSLSFAREGGFELAVEQCNGQGVCRKMSGVMCPSYQATREEMHSTRGRANLLRAMISRRQTVDDGRVMVGGLSSAVFEALDLCLACKGCKAECPSGVDIAKLKYEFENKYYRTHRRPLRDYVFGYFHIVASLLAPIAPMANALMSFAPTRKLIARMLGLAEERALPKFSTRRVTLSGAKSLRHGEEILRRRFAAPQNDTRKVIFLPDVFSRFIEPHVEEAALAVLSKCGYDVQVLPMVGAGASLLSKGFIDAAQIHARKTLEFLNQLDPAREAFIVGVEPPEVYLLKNDYEDLLPERTEEIHARASRVWMLDEFLLRSKEFDALRVASKKSHNPSQIGQQKIKLHPHCHQRAEGPSSDGIASGANASVELLRACGFEVELSEAGCCGMAGTFGYEAEHFALSMRIASLKLLPWLAPASPTRHFVTPSPNSQILGSDGVGATGASCRMQIRHGTGLEARHPIEWVRDALSL